eukprot:TRINITY_DN1799_c0_g1_i1.p1 TRINITY_DN1799_c0_g1~~TRINITY_DN1799_c0_g1_i1.p1  ORF type:complete len:211 (-),score=43.30 TRINITY_DN1799_c0_g1_i1:889-1521(-)
MDSAFSNFISKKGLQTDDPCEESQGTDNYQDQTQVKAAAVEVDLDELERQLFGGVESTRVTSWADEAEEYFGIETSTDSFGGTSTSLGGSSPRQDDSLTDTNILSSLYSLPTHFSSFAGAHGVNLPQRQYSIDTYFDEERQEGQWIQAKIQNQLSKQLPDLNEQQQCSGSSNEGGDDNQVKKRTRRRKRGGRRSRRRQSSTDSTQQEQNQ